MTLTESLDDRWALAWLVHIAGRRRARQLLLERGSPAAALAAFGGPAPDIAGLVAGLAAARAVLVTYDDAAFPPLLREIPDPPLLLYVAGEPSLLQAPAVAIVGARRCTRAGAEHAYNLARDLAAVGIPVVSGLALGIDGAAHRGALSTGPTLAVLGSGFSRIYPTVHRHLAREILGSGGVLISEHLPDHAARAYQFPERNRIISGLAAAVVVVEAGEQSGSLITARLALEQGREVLAVPGSISNPVARGCHRLLRQGAALVESISDILDALGWQLPDAQAQAQAQAQLKPSADDRPQPDSPALARVLSAIGPELTTFDEIVAAARLAAAVAAAHLLTLELAGFVAQVPGGYIRRARAGQ